MRSTLRQSLLNEGAVEIKPTCLNLPLRSCISLVTVESLRWFGLGLLCIAYFRRILHIESLISDITQSLKS